MSVPCWVLIIWTRKNHDFWKVVLLGVHHVHCTPWEKLNLANWKIIFHAKLRQHKYTDIKITEAWPKSEWRHRETPFTTRVCFLLFSFLVQLSIVHFKSFKWTNFSVLPLLQSLSKFRIGTAICFPVRWKIVISSSELSSLNAFSRSSSDTLSRIFWREIVSTMANFFLNEAKRAFFMCSQKFPDLSSFSSEPLTCIQGVLEHYKKTLIYSNEFYKDDVKHCFHCLVLKYMYITIEWWWLAAALLSLTKLTYATGSNLGRKVITPAL